MGTERNDIEEHIDDQLVVELRDAALVRDRLKHWAELDSTELDRDERLSLVLLRVRTATGGPPDSLADRLASLRAQFRDKAAQWAPSMDVNRALDTVYGSPYIKGGNLGSPLAAAEPVPIPALAKEPGPTVVVLDTRLYAHPDLAGRYRADPYPTDAPPTEARAGHATFLAGVILRQAAAGADRVAIDLRLRTVLDETGRNHSSWDVARKIAAVAAESEVAVINLSFGAATVDGVPPLVLRRAVDRISRDTVIVAAAGNNGGGDKFPGLKPETPMWPAAFDEVVAVGAHDGAGQFAAFSPDVPWLDLLAPGTDVVSTFLPGEVTSTEGGQTTVLDFGRGYARWRGSSFAAAAVTGEIVALMNAHRITARAALDRLLADQRTPAGATIGAPTIGDWAVS